MVQPSVSMVNVVVLPQVVVVEVDGILVVVVIVLVLVEVEVVDVVMQGEDMTDAILVVV